MIRVGIIGGAGYTAGELLRILLYHPAVEIAFVQSSSQVRSTGNGYSYRYYRGYLSEFPSRSGFLMR